MESIDPRVLEKEEYNKKSDRLKNILVMLASAGLLSSIVGMPLIYRHQFPTGSVILINIFTIGFVFIYYLYSRKLISYRVAKEFPSALLFSLVFFTTLWCGFPNGYQLYVLLIIPFISSLTSPKRIIIYTTISLGFIVSLLVCWSFFPDLVRWIIMHGEGSLYTRENFATLALEFTDYSSFVMVVVLLILFTFITKSFIKTNETYLTINKKLNKSLYNLNTCLYHENVSMKENLKATQYIQTFLLPSTEDLLNIRNFDITAYVYPSEMAGGDYYDVIEKEDETYFLIGDVTGHGLDSGLYMFMVQSFARMLITHYLKKSESPDSKIKFILSQINTLLVDNAKRVNNYNNHTYEKYMTMNVILCKNNKCYVTGLHENIYLIKNKEKLVKYETRNLGFMLGAMDDFERTLDIIEFNFEKNDRLFLYTDGVVQLMREKSSEMFEVDRLEKFLKLTKHKKPIDVKNDLIKELKDFSSDVKDDTTFMIIDKIGD